MTAAHELPICDRCGFVKKSCTVTEDGAVVAELPCERCFLNRLHFVGERYKAAVASGMHPDMATRVIIERGLDEAVEKERSP